MLYNPNKIWCNLVYYKRVAWRKVTTNNIRYGKLSVMVRRSGGQADNPTYQNCVKLCLKRSKTRDWKNLKNLLTLKVDSTEKNEFAQFYW